VTLKRRRRAFDDSSALSDLAFLLIIYFIIIAGFNVNKGFLMNLPAKDSTRLILKEDLLRFELAETGALFYQGSETDPSSAAALIREGIALRPNLAVVLAVSPQCPWQQVVAFVELAQSLNADSFSFTMKKDDAP
jgi:biopolymer transport protein ExbD